MKVCRGATRAVILVGKCAVKIPRTYSWSTFLRGLLANLQERLFWRSFKSPLLAKIYYSDPLGLVVVMERADSVFSDDEPVLRKSLEVFLRVCESEGLPVDPHYSNIGKFGKSWRLIDYGS